jgi:hypothetical protein
MKTMLLALVVVAVSLIVAATASGGSQQSFRFGDCNVSVAISRSADGRLLGSATMRCDTRKAKSEGWLSVTAQGVGGSGAFATPGLYSGLFTNSYGFGGRTLINGPHAIYGCVDARADFRARVDGVERAFSSGTSRICA